MSEHYKTYIKAFEDYLHDNWGVWLTTNDIRRATGKAQKNSLVDFLADTEYENFAYNLIEEKVGSTLYVLAVPKGIENSPGSIPAPPAQSKR